MVRNCILLLGDRVCAEASSTAMKKHLDSVKARRSPHGQLMHRASSIKLAFADEPGFECLETNCIRLYRKTKHFQCQGGRSLSFLRRLLSLPSEILPTPADLCEVDRAHAVQRQHWCHSHIMDTAHSLDPKPFLSYSEGTGTLRSTHRKQSPGKGNGFIRIHVMTLGLGGAGVQRGGGLGSHPHSSGFHVQTGWMGSSVISSCYFGQSHKKHP